MNFINTQKITNKTPFETSAVTQFGTKAMMMSKGNVDNAKQLTDMMGEYIAPTYRNVAQNVGQNRQNTKLKMNKLTIFMIYYKYRIVKEVMSLDEKDIPKSLPIF